MDIWKLLRCVLWSLCIFGGRNIACGERQKPFHCLKSYYCVDANEERFRCSEENVECCPKINKNLTVEEYPRGKQCCQGSGIFDVQTQQCVNGTIKYRSNVLPCGMSTFYNKDTQVCCESHGGNESKVYMADDYKTCCGIEYIHTHYRGCCNGVSYDKTVFCCKNQTVILPIGESYQTTGSMINDSHRFDERNCTQQVCSSLAMEKRFKLRRNMAAYMFSFQVGRIKGETSTHQVYKVKYGKQLFGRRGKIKAVEKSLKIVGLPKCGCPKRLQVGTDYVLLTKSKTHAKKLFLYGHKYFIMHVNASDVFAKVFNL